MKRSGFGLGRWFGIAVRVDWSWLFIFALTTFNLSSAFGGMHDDWALTLRWAVALVGALLFFGSVLAHELAHSLVARSQGTPVENITLFLFGGVSNIQEEPKSPRNEFVMALVGPLTSLVIGGVLVTAASLASGALGNVQGRPMEVVANLGPITTLALWLGTVNVALGVFNLIPGFPLDGGRVVRSILWAATDNLRTATRLASGLGQGIAWVMILAGIASAFGARLPLVGRGFANGLWLAFIGWFLSNASTQSYRRIVVEDILDDVSVGRIMREDPPTVAPNITLADFVHKRVMRSDDYGFPVVEGDRLVGIITLDDVRGVPRDEWGARTVGDAMTREDQLVTTSPDECASDAMQVLTQRDVRQLPVLRDGVLVGLLRRSDLVRWLRLHSELS